jgi:hypothetical protein
VIGVLLEVCSDVDQICGRPLYIANSLVLTSLFLALHTNSHDEIRVGKHLLYYFAIKGFVSFARCKDTRRQCTHVRNITSFIV